MLRASKLATIIALLSAAVPSPASSQRGVQINLHDASVISAYAGVGFDRNPVARLNGYENGHEVKDKSRFTAEIDWGDGSGWQPGEIAIAGDGAPFIVKGSHNYASAGDYAVRVRATLSDTSMVRRTTHVRVMDLPDPRARPPQAAASHISGEPKDVILSIADASVIYSFAGVGFVRNRLGEVNGLVDGAVDTDKSGYHVQINWGDSGAWTAGEVGLNAEGNGFVLKGTHTYRAAGTYPVIVHVAGPDGTTLDRRSTLVRVVQMPSGRSQPITQPTSRVAGEPREISISINDASPLRATVGSSLQQAKLAEATVLLNGSPVRSVSEVSALVNWGDSGAWSAATVSRMPSGHGFVIRGTHTYREAGAYPVVLRIAGPDGETLDRRTTMVTVASRPGG